MIYTEREQLICPTDIQRKIHQVGGSHVFGEANFRLVWGGSRLELQGGEWFDQDEHGVLTRRVVEYRREPKYFINGGLERWHLEKWVGPEMFVSPEHWEMSTSEWIDGQKVMQLGPFPSRGEYEHCFTLQTAEGEFVGLNDVGIVEDLIQAVEHCRHLTSTDRQLARDRREDAKERDFDCGFDEIWEDSMPAMHGQPKVGYGHQLADKSEEISKNSVDLPPIHSKTTRGAIQL